MGAIEIAGTILSRANQRVEVSAQNIANMTTPGYKARRQFSVALGNAQSQAAPAATGIGPAQPNFDFTIGKLQMTENPLDLAISGPGFFAVRSGSDTYYTRNGQFSRDADGHLVTADGMILQSSQGDVTVSSANAQILPDGTIMDGGQPTAQITVVDFPDPRALQPVGNGVFSAPTGAIPGAANSEVRQGMLEASNVSTAEEMMSIMAALRSAQSGQHIAQMYDELMDRVLTAFGQT